MEHKLIFGDCLEIMKDIPDKSIDMILTDPPYGTTHNKWDSIIPLNKMWKELKRIIKTNGAIVMTAGQPFTSNLIMSNTDMFKYCLVWQKSKATNFLNSKKQPLRKYEDICVFYSKQPVYNPQMSEGKPYDKGVRKNQQTGSYGDFKPSHVHSKGLRYPTDVVYFKTAESDGEVYHPNQKPIALMEYLIKTYTNEEDTILDFTCGSGSTNVAAKNLKRNSIGIDNWFCEKDKIINEISIKGLKWTEITQLRLDGKI